MSTFQSTPYDRVAQRALTREWDAAIDGRLALTQTRELVRDSWQRSLQAAVPADLPRAPLVLADATLRLAQERADWVPLARRAAEQLSDAFTNGHILSLFDAEGHMLSCDGDPAVLEGLAAINFRPGGLWTEAAVGTNGPGTALATRRPVHIVGAEHYCEAWHGWHCAAVPVADITTNDLLGVIDISGFSRHAHPHTLQLAAALASSVREMLTAREMERRCAVLHRFAQLSCRYGQDALVAVDRHGVVLHATERTPAGLRPGTETPPALRRALVQHVQTFDAHGPVAESTEVFLSLGHDIGLSAMSFPVFDGSRIVGTCLLLRNSASVFDRAAGLVTVSAPLAPLPAARTNGGRRDIPRIAEQETKAVVHARTPAAGDALREIVGSSPRMVESLRLATAASRNTLPLLLLGESGTGKEVFAQAIHHASARRDRPFIAVNCAALPRELVEAELFGYVGGAFTGARREGSPGKFRAAEGGTIFLDEISEMPYSAQAALLRVLQEQEVCAVGSSEVRALDVRVMAATNRDVVDAVRAGVLRADLYHRLNVLAIALPPLRDRRADIAALAETLLRHAATEVQRPGLRFDPAVMPVLMAYDWPGNVRELGNALRRAAALCTDDCVRVADLPWTSSPSVQVVDRVERLGEAGDERARIVAALMTARTMADAAARLGVNRSTLYRKLERYGLRAERLLSAQ